MEAAAKYRRVEHPRRLAQRFQPRPQRCAFHQQELAFHMLRLELRGGAHCNYAPAINQHQAIAVFRLVHVMGGHEHRDALAHHLLDQFPEFPARDGIDTRSRLVKKDNGRTMQHRAPQR